MTRQPVAQHHTRWIFPRLLVATTLALFLAVVSTARAASPQEVKLTAQEFSFMPNTVTLTVGQPVHLTVVNAGKLAHDIKSDIPIANLTYIRANNDPSEQKENAEKGIFDVDFDAGATSEVTFTPTKPGTYPFKCDVPGHAEAGMTGTFVVQAAATAPAASSQQPTTIAAAANAPTPTSATAAPTATTTAPGQLPRTGGGTSPSAPATLWLIGLGVLGLIVLGGGIYAMRQRA